MKPWWFSRSYWVADEGGWCAGNLRRRAAVEYAQARRSLGHVAVVVRLREGRIVVVWNPK